MKKLFLIMSLALLGTAHAGEQATLKPVLENGKVFVSGQECKAVNYFYREYFKPTKKQIEALKSAEFPDFIMAEDTDTFKKDSVTNYSLKGLAYRQEIDAPTAMGLGGDALLYAVADYISQGAELHYNTPSKTCTFIVNDMKYVK